MTYPIFTVSLFLVAFLGFASHRASLCTVRAVAEILSTRRAYLLWSFAKTVLWVMAVSLAIMSLSPGRGPAFQSHAPTLAALAGGFLFGAGAAVNGGCSFSTLQRLADGEVWMLAALGGYGAGAAAWMEFAPAFGIAPGPSATGAGPEPGGWTPVALGLLWLWGAWELAQLWRARPRNAGLRQIVGADPYRLSAAALVIGASGGFLYSLNDSWTYTNTLRGAAAFLLGREGAPSAHQGWLLLALFLGMLLSSWQRSRIRLRSRPFREGLRHLAGGLMMGMGGAVIPGGNDTLILKGIPTFSPDALGMYLSLIAGIASVLLTIRAIRGSMITVDCSGDVCRADRRS
ncbi:MAG: YeeE/YedE family protein [Betaproteobacteria bacterium]|nr:YeeE/YedE family protein [Betaproteobacteria bacterium]